MFSDAHGDIAPYHDEISTKKQQLPVMPPTSIFKTPQFNQNKRCWLGRKQTTMTFLYNMVLGVVSGVILAS